MQELSLFKDIYFRDATSIRASYPTHYFVDTVRVTFNGTIEVINNSVDSRELCGAPCMEAKRSIDDISFTITVVSRQDFRRMKLAGSPQKGDALERVEERKP